MSVILTINKTGLGGCSNGRRLRGSKNVAYSSRNILSMKKKPATLGKNRDQDNSAVKVNKLGLVLTISVVLLGIFYLYQVNDLANKGYEMKEVETRIANLLEANEKNKIRELELRSMYNIEKATENLDLVNSSNVSYLEIDGPIAMK